MIMPEFTRLDGDCDGIDLDFVERESTPRSFVALGIRAHLAGLSLSNTVKFLKWLGVDRSRPAVHHWVQKVGLQPTAGKQPSRRG